MNRLNNDQVRKLIELMNDPEECKKLGMDQEEVKRVAMKELLTEDCSVIQNESYEDMVVRCEKEYGVTEADYRKYTK